MSPVEKARLLSNAWFIFSGSLTSGRPQLTATVKPSGHGELMPLGVSRGHVWAEVPQLPNTQRSTAYWLQGIWGLDQGSRG